MGVGGLWDLLKPYARLECPDFLVNKRVAVDLSFWIVQHETAIKARVRNPHLRLIFFRTINLFSKFGAFPVFVTDGTPSPLKSRARIARFFHASGIDLSDLPVAEEGVSIERNTAFSKCVQECVELLELFGMPVVKAKGEAEALCAQLDSEGYVDACVTADSDAFLFGAKCVIKFVRPNSKEPFECYHMSDIEAGLGLKRKHLIAISLLVGNDHDLNGVQGIGLDTALRFVQSFSEDEILIESESSPDWYHSSTSAILNTPKNTLQLDMVSQRRRKKKDYSSKSPLSSVEANKENLNAASKKKIVGFSRKVCQFSALNENIDQSQKKKYPTTPRFRINKDNSKSKDISTPNGSEDCFLEKEYHQNILRSFSSDTLREESTTPEVLKSRKEADLCSKMKKPLQNPDRFAERKPQERAKKYRKRRSKSLENNTNLPSSSGIRPLQVPVRRARGPREGTLNVPLRMELTKSSSEKSLNRTQISTMELRPERPLRSKSQEKISPRKPPWKP